MFNGEESGIQLSFDEASKKVKKFNSNRNKGAIKAHYFSRAVLEKLLSDPIMVGVRFYTGMNDKSDLDNFLVAVNKQGENLFKKTLDASTEIYASALPCPEFCPPQSSDFA